MPDGASPFVGRGTRLMLSHWRGQHDAYTYAQRAVSTCPMCEQVNAEVDLSGQENPS